MAYAKTKPAGNQQRTLTPEEQESQIKRAVMQKKAALAEGILFNMVQGLGFIPDTDDCKNIAKASNDIADEFMNVVYGQEITYKEKSAE